MSPQALYELWCGLARQSSIQFHQRLFRNHDDAAARDQFTFSGSGMLPQEIFPLAEWENIAVLVKDGGRSFHQVCFEAPPLMLRVTWPIRGKQPAFVLLNCDQKAELEALGYKDVTRYRRINRRPLSDDELLYIERIFREASG